MPLPWQGAYRVRNLRTRSQLTRKKHLSVLKEGENVGSTPADYKRGLRAEWKTVRGFKQKFRGKKGESILSDSHYLGPLVSVFTAAVRRMMTGDS